MRAPVVAAVVVVTTAAVAAADPLDRIGAVATADADFGHTDSAGLRLWLGGAGAELRPSSMFTIAALALGAGSSGATAAGVHAHGGFGGELVLAVRPFDTGPLRPYLRWSAGMLGFPGAPFEPGGGAYEFVLHAGAGIEATLVPRVTLALHGDVGHVSNGQGLGAQNPAFDGYGGGLDVAYALAEPPPASEADPALPPRAWPALAALVDGALGSAGGLLGTGRIRAALPLGETLAVQLDGEAGTLAGHGFVEVGGDVVAYTPIATIGAHGGFRDYAGIHTAIAQLQGDFHVTAATSVVFSTAIEPSTLDSVLATGLGLRISPLPCLAVDAGEGVRLDFTGNGSVAAAPYFGGQWQLPIATLGGRVELFYERQLAGADEAGLRFALGGTGVRGPIWRRLR